MNETTCDRCDETNALEDVKLVEHWDGSGEVVCILCLVNEREEELKRAGY